MDSNPDSTSTGAPSSSKGVWVSGEAYEPYMGRWSRSIAKRFVAWLGMPTGARWLDVGCGTGALVQSALEMAGPSAIVALDRSGDYLAFAHERIQDKRVHWELGNAEALPYPEASFDVVVSGLMLNFVADSRAVVREMVRVATPRSTIAAYVWDYAGQMQILRHFWDAAIALEPSVRRLDEAERSPLCRPESLDQLFRGEGLVDVSVRAVDAPAVFGCFDEYWRPFLGGQGTVASYAMSLSESRRTELRNAIAARLPTSPDGSIPLVVRAWAVRGVRPERSA